MRGRHGCGAHGTATAMFTLNADLIAQMSCNPAIGGIAKGHLVREVDALGGIMGEVADAVGIQFRLLNTSRGPAVWSPRAQCDKQQYRVEDARECWSRSRTSASSRPKSPTSSLKLRTGRNGVAGVHRSADGRTSCARRPSSSRPEHF